MQVHLSNGLPAMAIVGLADKAVGESRERVRAALSSLGLALPQDAVDEHLVLGELSLDGSIQPSRSGSTFLSRRASEWAIT